MGRKEDCDNNRMLEHALERLRALFDGIDELIYVSDPDTYEILFANKKLKELAGNGILGRKCYNIFQNLDHPCAFCTNKYIFEENLGNTHIWEHRNRRNKHWYKCVNKAIEWPNTKNVRFGIAIDVTELKQTEEKLKSAKTQQWRSYGPTKPHANRRV